jgi:hypothetical protein
LAAQLLDSLPPEVSSKLLGKLNLQAIVSHLQQNAGNDELNTLLSVLGGGSAASILTQLQTGGMGMSTATGTGTSTATMTSTGTGTGSGA